MKKDSDSIEGTSLASETRPPRKALRRRAKTKTMTNGVRCELSLAPLSINDKVEVNNAKELKHIRCMCAYSPAVQVL